VERHKNNPKELHENIGFNLQNRQNSSSSSGQPWTANKKLVAIGGAGVRSSDGLDQGTE
jgi:hypothetical protein